MTFDIETLTLPNEPKATNPVWSLTHFGQLTGFHVGYLGYVPTFLDTEDPRPAAEQFDEAYGHGGGWRNFDGFKMDAEFRLISKYPEDPAMEPLAEANLRDERIFYYDSSWVAIVQPDGAFSVSRID